MSRTFVHAPVKVQITRSLGIPFDAYEGLNGSWYPEERDDALEAQIHGCWVRREVHVWRYRSERLENHYNERAHRASKRDTLRVLARLTPSQIAESDGDLEIAGRLRAR